MFLYSLVPIFEQLKIKKVVVVGFSDGKLVASIDGSCSSCLESVHNSCDLRTERCRLSGKSRRIRIDSRRASKRDATKFALPEGAVIADLSQQVPNNSYAAPVLFYIDKPFACIGCGKNEIWTAQQQQWYYEVAKGSLYATAVRCRSCRKDHAAVHSGNGDPNPIKHLGTLIKRVQSAIATAIAEAGFVFVSKSMLPIKGSFALDYSRGNFFLTCWYDRPNATLIAEVLDNAANCTRIASIPMNAPRSGPQVLDRISEFADEVIQYLVSLPPTGDAG